MTMSIEERNRLVALEQIAEKQAGELSELREAIAKLNDRKKPGPKPKSRDDQSATDD